MRFFIIAIALLVLASPARAEDGPPLWKVTDADSTVYLMGSFHLMKPGADWMNPTVTMAFDSARDVWFEITDLDNPAAAGPIVMKYGFYPAPELDAHLTDADKAALDADLDRHGMARAAMQQIRPWLVATVLTEKAAADAGFDAKSGVDLTLYTRARANGQAIHAFETMEQQIALLAGIDGQDGLTFLRETIADDQDGAAKLNQMADDWLHHDEAALTRDVVDEMKAEDARLYQTLLVDRNAAWVPQIETVLKGSGTVFVTVGAAHLLGDDGVVARLKTDGWKVEKIE